MSLWRPRQGARQTGLLLLLTILTASAVGAGVDLRTGNLIVSDRDADPFGFGDARGALVLVDEGAVVPVQLITSPARFVDPVATLPLGDGTILCVDDNSDPFFDGQNRGAIWLIDPSEDLPGTASLFTASREWRTPIDILEEANGDILVLDADADPLGTGVRPGALYRVLRANRQILQIATSLQWQDPRSMVYDIDGSVLIWDTSADPLGLGTSPGALFRVDPVTGIVDFVFSTDEFVTPHAIAIDRNGNYLVLDRDANPDGFEGAPGGIYRVDRSDLSVEPLFFSPEFREPADLSIDPSGDLWVVDEDANPFQFPTAKGAVFRCDIGTGEIVKTIASGFFRGISGVTQFSGTALDSSQVSWRDLSGAPLRPGDRMEVVVRPRNTGSVPGRPVTLEHEVGVWWDYRAGSDSVSHGAFSYDPSTRKVSWVGDVEVQGEAMIRYELRLRDVAPDGLFLTERLTLNVSLSGSPFSLRSQVSERSEPGRVVWADYRLTPPTTTGTILEKIPNEILATQVFAGAPLVQPDDLAFLDDGTIAVLDRRSRPLGAEGLAGGIYRIDPLTGSVDTLLAVGAYPELRFPVGIGKGQSGEILIIDKDANPAGHPGLPGAIFSFRLDSETLTPIASDPAFVEPSDAILESTGRILAIDYDADPFGTNPRGGALFEIDPANGSVAPISFPVERFVDPVGLAEGPGRRIYIADLSADPIGIGRNTGAIFMVQRDLGNALTIASADSAYVDPTDLYATEAGDLIVCDREANPLDLPARDHGAIFRVRPLVGDPEVVAADPTLYGPEAVAGFLLGRVGSASLDVTKLGSGPTQEGDTLRFEALLRNTGRVAVGEAMATISFSNDLELLDAEASGDLLLDRNGRAVSWLGPVNIGETVTVRADARVGVGLDFGERVFGLLKVSAPGAAIPDSATMRVVAPLGPGNLILVDRNADPQNLGQADGALFLLRSDTGKAQDVLLTDPEWVEPTALESFDEGRFLLTDTRLSEPGVVLRVDYLNETSELFLEDPCLGSPNDLHRLRTGELLIVDPFARVEPSGPIGPAIFTQRAEEEEISIFSVDPSLRQPLQVTEDDQGRVWVVDRGADPNGVDQPGRGALFRLDPTTGAVIDTLQFDLFAAPTAILSWAGEGLIVVDETARGDWDGTGAVFLIDPDQRSLKVLVTDARFRRPHSASFAASGELWITDRIARDESLPGSPRTLFEWDPETGLVETVAASAGYVAPSEILGLPGPNPRMSYILDDLNGPPIEAADELVIRVTLENLGPVGTSSASFRDTLANLVALDRESVQAEDGFVEFQEGFNGLVWSVDLPEESRRDLTYRVQVRQSTLQGTPLLFRAHLRTREGVHRATRFVERIPVYLEDGHLYLADADSDPFGFQGSPGALWKIDLRTGRATVMASSVQLKDPVQVVMLPKTEPELLIVDALSNPNGYVRGRGGLWRWMPGTTEFSLIAADSLFRNPRDAVPINDHEVLLLDTWADPLDLIEGPGLGPGAVFLVDVQTGQVEFFASDTMLVSPVGMLSDGRGGVLIIDERADPLRFGLRNGAIFRLDLAERRLGLHAASADFRNPVAGTIKRDGTLLIADRDASFEQDPAARGAIFRVDQMGNVSLEASSPRFRFLHDIDVDSEGRIVVSDREADPRGTSGRYGAIFRQAGAQFTVVASVFQFVNPSGFFLWDAVTAIELTALEAVAMQEGIRVTWRCSDLTFDGFLCLRAEGSDPQPEDYRILNEAEPVSGRGPFEFLDTGVTPGTDYSYLILGLLPGGGEMFYGPIQATAIRIARLALSPPIPNPTQGETRLRFLLPRQSRVELKIFDLNGRCVRRLLDRSLPFGPHTIGWDGRNDRGHPVASGLYLLRLSIPNEVVTRRMVLLR